MVQFRCWYCWKKYSVKDSRIGEHITCACDRTLRVPKRDDGNCRVWTPIDWVVEIVVYGCGGALLGLGLSILIVWRFMFFVGFTERLVLIAALTVIGFLAGLFGGSRGIDWLGQMIRDREDR
jgi:hypothetical protein